MKPAVVRFYFDADVLGLAKVIAGLRSDVTYPGDPGAIVHKRQRPACFVASPEVKDHVWIPEVATRGLLIVTRDRHIRSRPAELAAVRDHRARMVALGGADAHTTWTQLEVLMTQWRRIDALVEPGPFIYRASRTGGLVKVL